MIEEPTLLRRMPDRYWRRTPEGAVEDSAFMARVMWLWDRGYDTARIAMDLHEHESVVARCVRAGRERRRGCGNT